MIQRFAANTAGRDLIVGDIHGCFSKLTKALDDAGFDPDCDRVFSVGDLVDRGPESQCAIAWLAQPWFHAIRGNHEVMAIDAAAGNYDEYSHRGNGGAWFYELSPQHQQHIADTFSRMPIAIELETEQGLVGIVHAECPAPTWADMVAALGRQDWRDNGFETACVWSRARIRSRNDAMVPDVRAVVSGHTEVLQATTLGNHIFIDTRGWSERGHGFTVLDARTLSRAYRPTFSVQSNTQSTKHGQSGKMNNTQPNPMEMCP